MRIAIKADGGRAAGFGHLGRCLALAQAFRARGADAVFVDVPAECRSWVRRRGFKTKRLSAARWDILVGDSYTFTPAQVLEMRRSSEVFVFIDDHGDFRGPCDWILNPMIGAHRRAFQAPPDASLMLGPRFQLLRREYWRPTRPRHFPPRIRRCLVSVGGGEADGTARRVAAAAAAALPQAEVHLILGVLGNRRSETALLPNIRAHQDLPSLRPLLSSCDAAVLAGGQTLCEAVCAGTPSVAFSRARNQSIHISGLTECAGIAYAGSGAGPAVLARIRTALRRMDRDPGLRRRMSEAGRRTFDGRGAVRAAATLLASHRRRS